MSLLPSLLLVLLALLGGALPTATSMTNSMWHRAQVPRDQLTAAAMSTSYQVFDEIFCAILATTNEWCHLFTHEGNTCVLYDVVVDSLAAPPSEDTATPCKTRHRNVCIVEGTPHPHGNTLDHNCLNTTCWNRALVPTNPVSSTCDTPFFRVSMGCVHLFKKEITWCEARQYCESLKADLAVVTPESFSKLQEFCATYKADKGVWVGAKARKWMDGREVATTEWGPFQPNGAADECVKIKKNANRYALYDNICTKKHWVLCMST